MQIRRYEASDRATVRALAPRLTDGVAPWRDEAAVLSEVRSWVDAALASADDQHPVFVAECAGRVVGFAAAGARQHWTGEVDAYIGELAVAADHTARGIGRALVAAAETWARASGYGRITLETGAANHRARTFYRDLGYADEEVVLTRTLT